MNCTVEEVVDRMRLWYNGYRQHPADPPEAVLNFLNASGAEMRAYWGRQAPPSVLQRVGGARDRRGGRAGD